MRKINKIILHCSASGFGSADVIDSWHKQRGWSGCGYHYVVCNGYEGSRDQFQSNVNDGEIQVGRPLEKAGAHAYGHNKNSIGICMIGTTVFTEKQFRALGDLVRGLLIQFELEIEDVIPHSAVDTHGKTCPNFSVEEFVNKYVIEEDK